MNLQQNPQVVQNESEQLSPLSLSSHHGKMKSYTHANSVNFIKSIHNGYGNNLVCLYEQNPFTVQFRGINSNQKSMGNLIKYQNFQMIESKQYQMQDLTVKDGDITGQLQFESVPYDCLEFKQDFWIVSTKGMPPRIYKKSNEQSLKIDHIGSISNKKKNSERYLSPIQITSHENKSNYAVGGGRQFLCTYNLELTAQDSHYPAFDKVNVSAVEMMSQNTVVVGNFEGGISVVDLRNQQTSMKVECKKIKNNSFLRPHVDAVMGLVSNKQNQYIFASSARKDNYIYIWDCRMFGTNGTKYIAELITPREGNQRISMNFGNDGKILYTGSEFSSILGWHFEQFDQTGANVQKWKVSEEQNIVVNSVIYKRDINSLIFSTGTRTFQQFEDQQQIGMKNEKIKQKECENILGLIRL